MTDPLAPTSDDDSGFPDSAGEEDWPLVPARMLNEFTYCPRLGYLEWAQAEWAPSADTLHGEFVHRNVDREDRRALPVGDADSPDAIHRRSLRLEDAGLGLVAVVDVIELEGERATPVDYKRGKAPDLPEGAWEPERVQLCAQGLLLRAAGFQCDQGVVYYAESKERVTVEFDALLIVRTRELLAEFRRTAASGKIPLPLVDSPKCPRCSLVSICLPDETNWLNAHPPTEDEEAEGAPAPAKGDRPRLALTPRDDAKPLHLSEQGAYVGKSGERLKVTLKGKHLADVKLIDVSQVCLYGNIQMTTQALAELVERQIPVCYFTQSGWFHGMTTGLAHRNVEVRIRQYAAAADPALALPLARAFVGGKIRNCRTILRRNLEHDLDRVLDRLVELATDAERASSAESLLGLEGMAAKLYFAAFATLLKPGFDFEGRNRRPPKDPVNATLSFLYSLLAKEAHVSAQAAGLDPMLGILHKPRYGRPSLALDLAEEFRPLLADSVALSLMNTGELKDAHFVRRAGACGLTPAGRRAVLSGWERRLSSEVTHPVFGYVLSYRRVIALQARLLVRALTGEIPGYPPFKTR
jgi:CRISPR-associated protein Cas1